MTKEKVQILDTKVFNKSIYYFCQENIIIIRIKPGIVMELEDAQAERNYLFKEKPHYLPMKIMVVPGDGAQVSKEVRDFSNLPESVEMNEAQAIVINTLAHRIMINFMKKFYKAPMPIKVFSKEDDALEWLLNYNKDLT